MLCAVLCSSDGIFKYLRCHHYSICFVFVSAESFHLRYFFFFSLGISLYIVNITLRLCYPSPAFFSLPFPIIPPELLLLNTTKPSHTILYHTISYHTILYMHTKPYHTLQHVHHTIQHLATGPGQFFFFISLVTLSLFFFFFFFLWHFALFLSLLLLLLLLYTCLTYLPVLFSFSSRCRRRLVDCSSQFMVHSSWFICRK